MVRAPDCGSGGRRFDSDYPPHLKLTPSPEIWGFFTQKPQKQNIGVSSSGKTQHFDCCIRRFESCHPSQHPRCAFWRDVGVFCGYSQDSQFSSKQPCREAERSVKSRAHVKHRAPPRAVEVLVSTEYPATPAKKPKAKAFGFFSCVRRTQHHLRAHATSFVPWLNIIPPQGGHK